MTGEMKVLLIEAVVKGYHECYQFMGNLRGTCEKVKFSLLYFSLYVEEQGKWPDLLLIYVGVGTFKTRCSMNLCLFIIQGCS